jgi:hypothetical protein
MADDATLRDSVVNDQTATTQTQDATTTTTTTTDATPRILDAPDPEAVEIGRILQASGVTKDQVNDLLQAPRALEALRAAVQGNPSEFFNMLQRTDPKSEENLLEAAADRYVQRYGDKAKPSGNGKPDATSDLMREVEALREKTNRLETEQQRRDQAVALAATRQRFEARVDDLLNLDGVKQLGLTKAETRAMRAQLDVELSKDSSIVERASKGNFVDVPKVFQNIVENWANDKKAAAKAVEEERTRVQKNAFSEFSNGANPFMNIEVPAAASESWDATEAALVKALGGAR